MKRWRLGLLVALLLLPGSAQAKIFLADTDDTLQVVTASGVTTMHMYASWADITTTALTPGSSSARVTTATTTTLVAAPGASTQRQIKGFSIRNNHASSSNLVTVRFFDGTNATELIAYTLLAGETLQWGEDENFRVIDASGQVKGTVALATGSNTIGALTANQSVNVAQMNGVTTTMGNGTSGTGVQRVTIASDSTGQVTANAGTNLNTSALLTTSAHDAAFGTAGTADAQVRTVQGIASMTPLQVQSNSQNLATAANQDGIIRDGTGDTTQANVSSGSLHVACQSGCSGGTQYAEDTVHSSGDTLTLAGVVRQDSTAALAADGDRTLLQVNANGHLKVVNDNPNLAADNSTLSTAKVPVLAGTVSTSAPTWTSGNQSALSLQTDGSVRSAITNFPSTASTSALSIRCVNTAGNAFEACGGGGGGGGTSLTDNSAFTFGSTSVTPLAGVLDDTSTNTATENSAAVARITPQKGLHVNLRNQSGTEMGTSSAPIRIDPTGTTAQTVNNFTASNLKVEPVGNIAHDAADSGNPVKIGCQARTTNRTAVADADRADCVSDKNGQIVVTPMAPRDRVVRSGVVTLTNTTETTLIAAGGAGVFRDLTYLKCTNNSATLVRVDLRDATAGTVIDSWALAASGGGFNLAFTVPYAQATANNNWTVQLSGSVTDVRCSAQAVEKN